jgi:8-amino-7-oxononanoate synthase
VSARVERGEKATAPSPEKEWASELSSLEARGLKRSLVAQSTPALPEVERRGRRLVNLASNNYLGLAADPRLVAAARQGLERWGVGAGASRLVCGDLDVHRALEAALADLKETDAALAFTSGYAANVGVLTTLAGPRDHVFADALNHASLIDGCRQSRAAVHRYDHGEVEHLARLLRGTPARGRRLIVTDSVFSMDGDVAPLADLADLAERWGATLVADEAHATGVLGEQGRGLVHHLGLGSRVPVQIGTLSKALGVQGGFVAGSHVLVALLLHRARSFVYSTGMAPVLAAAALAAVTIAREEEWRRERQRAHLATLRSALSGLGYTITGDSLAPMTSVIVGAPDAALELAARLEGAGVLAPAIRPPSVPPGTSRLRLAPMATHTDAQMERVVAAVEAGPELGV